MSHIRKAEPEILKIEAIIQPYKVDEVKAALSVLGIGRVTISEVRGFGRQKGHTELYHGAECVVDFLPKTKLELIISEALAERAVQAIASSARTGRVGDGKIFVLPLAEIVQIRAGERVGEALG